MKRFLFLLFVFLFAGSAYGQVLASDESSFTTGTSARVKAILIQLDIKSKIVNEDTIKELITKFYDDSTDKKLSSLSIIFANQKLDSRFQLDQYIKSNTSFNGEEVVKFKLKARDLQFDNVDRAFFIFNLEDVVYDYWDKSQIYNDYHIASHEVISIEKDTKMEKIKGEFICAFAVMQYSEFKINDINSLCKKG